MLQCKNKFLGTELSNCISFTLMQHVDTIENADRGVYDLMLPKVVLGFFVHPEFSKAKFGLY